VARTILGIDRVVRDRIALPGRGRAGLLCNATTVTSDWVPTAEALRGVTGLRLERIFSPQHGFAAEKQDNMIESADGVHARLGVPIVSLYGARREPAPAALDGLDCLLIDLPDVGTRVYTFLVTALLVLRAAAARGLPAIVLDRPNPIGGAVEGPVLEDAFRSFVGLLDVPLRHGLTAGEFCCYGRARLGLPGGDDFLRVVPLEGWERRPWYDETGLPWTMPSPNMPSLETAIVYPGQVILEGTGLSEGRGTTRPFEIFGAPFIHAETLVKLLREFRLPGVVFRPASFQPTFQKYAGRLCGGAQIHVTDREKFKPFRTGVAILKAVHNTWPREFAWKQPPYEYEDIKMPIDILAGSDRLRKDIESWKDIRQMESWWKDELKEFEKVRKRYLLYK